MQENLNSNNLESKITNNNFEEITEQISEESSEEETYIDINDLIKEQLKNIYQIQLCNDNLMIKHIGIGTHVPDIIIKESFGKKNNLSLYNCVYLEDETNFLKSEQNSNKLLPVIKLIEKLDNHTNIYALSVKIQNFTNYNEYINNFDIYLTYTSNKNNFYHVEITKNIDHNNIIEKMLGHIIDFGFDIL